MIKLNGIEIDSTVSFEQTIDFNEWWRKQTLDCRTHRQVKSKKEEISCTFAPRTAADNDLLWEELQNYSGSDDTVILEYPGSSTGTAVKEMLVTKISRQLIRRKNGINKFGEISVTFTEA